MTREENIRAILECNFAGFKDDIIDIAVKRICEIEQEPKQGHCRDCKWWKDSDSTYRRGCGAESICPINSKTVYDGEGYCYLFSKNE